MKAITEKKGIFKRTYIWYADELKNYPSSYVKYIGYKQFPKNNFTELKHKTILVDLKKNENEIYSNFEKRCRNDITKAEKENLKVEISNEFEDFYKIYSKFCKEIKITPWSLNFLKQLRLLLHEASSSECTISQNPSTFNEKGDASAEIQLTANNGGSASVSPARSTSNTDNRSVACRS